MSVEKQVSARNYKAFIWHGLFLALASNFMDVNTVIPSMLIKVGANSVHLGFLTAIMIGGASFMQLIFSALLSNASFKKIWLLTGINIRIVMLLLMALLFNLSPTLSSYFIFISIYVLITIFAFSGAFANVSYIDIIGKTINSQKRKHFFSLKQIINSFGVLTSAILASRVIKSFSYPSNYFYMFLIAGILLLVASMGFYAIYEKTPSGSKPKSLKSFFKSMPKEIKNNSNLKYYLFIINTLGIGVSLIPFIILLAKEGIGLSFDKVGNFIIYQTVGMIIGSLTLYLLAKRFKYKTVLLFDLFLGASIPIIALLLRNNVNLFDYIFILTGIFASTYKVSVNGMLIEISNTENRTLYAGISGAGNIIPMIFPIIMGLFIKFLGYEIVFSSITILILSSIYAIRKLNCT